MTKRGMRLWSPFPGESATMYKYFTYFLQLPIEYRSISNVARYITSHLRGLSLEELLAGERTEYMSIASKLNDENLFWYARSSAFEESISLQLVEAMQETQRDRLAVMQQKASTIALLSNDLALQMLVAASAKLQSVEPEELRLSDVGAYAKIAGMLTRDGLAVMENATALADVLAFIEEQENMRNIEIIDG
jgi:hypothetical protein